MSIKVVSVRRLVVGQRGITYVGRSCMGWRASALGNPFRIGADGDRKEVIEKYRVWLYGQVKMKGAAYLELMRLVKRYQRNEDIVLGCWCYPEQCHAEVIERAVKWLSSIQEKGGA